MRKIFTTTFISLDGVMQDPHMWSFPYWNDQIAQYKFNETMGSDALLLGRITYEGFAQAWPGRTDEQGFADRYNSFPKYVVSTTLQKADWNNSHIIRDNIVDEIKKLKAETGQDIQVSGSATLIEFLMRHNLIDEYRMLLYPIVLGSGRRLFPDNVKAPLELVDAVPMGSGVVALTYRPAPAGAANERDHPYGESEG